MAHKFCFVIFHQLFLAGADCFRLNFSHGSQEQKKELLMTIREIEEKYSHPIGILGDLQGPKLRVSSINASDGTLFVINATHKKHCERIGAK